MGVGERGRRRLIALALLLAGLIALAGPQVSAMLTPAATPDAPEAWSLCETPDRCRPIAVADLSLTAPITILRSTFVADEATPTTPLAVHLLGTASAEVWWNGERIGSNGVVGADRAHETSGRFSAVIPVPSNRIRPGANAVEVRLSSHHLWAPIRQPIHHLSVRPYSDPLRGTLRHYLPTLLLTGVLALAVVGAGVLWVRRRGPGPAALVAITCAVFIQAVIETSKLALTYAYPWQLNRLAAVAGLTAVTALALGLAAQVFVWDRRLRWGLAAALVLALAIALFGPPWWDAKALWAFRAGVTAALVAATVGALDAQPRARTAQIAAVVALALSWAPDFLDSGYYLLVLALFGWVAVETLRRRPAVPTSESPDEILSIPDGASRHRVRADEIVHVRAADDYSVVTLADGRELLSTANLAALIRLAPARLLRIHRSHAINPARIATIHRSGKAGRTVELQGGARLAIGRTYWAALNQRIG